MCRAVAGAAHQSGCDVPSCCLTGCFWSARRSQGHFSDYESSESQNIPDRKGTARTIEWSTQDHPKFKPYVWEWCSNAPWSPALTALGSPFHAHRPLVQHLSLTPSCPSPDTAPCRSLGPCRCHREQSSALPLCSLWGAAAAMRAPLSCSALGWVHPGTSALPQTPCPPDLSPLLQSSLGLSIKVLRLSHIVASKDAPSAGSEAVKHRTEKDNRFLCLAGSAGPDAPQGTGVFYLLKGFYWDAHKTLPKRKIRWSCSSSRCHALHLNLL